MTTRAEEVSDRGGPACCLMATRAFACTEDGLRSQGQPYDQAPERKERLE